MMGADVSSVARLLRGEAPEFVTMDLLGGFGGGGPAEDEVVDLEVTVPAGWERRLDLLSGKTFLTPRHPSVQDGHQDLNLSPPSAAAAITNSSAVCTLDMVRSAVERATADRTTASPTTSSASTSSSSTVGKRNRSPQPMMCATACRSCLMYVLIAEADTECPRCAARVPPLGGKSTTAAEGSSKKSRMIDLNVAADDNEME